MQGFFLQYYNEIFLGACVIFGAAGMYIFSDYKGFENSKSFLKAQFPRRKKVFYSRADFLMTTVMGSTIGLITFQPDTAYEALAAGFGWTGAMNVLMRSGEQRDA